MPDLKQHILCRLKEQLQQETKGCAMEPVRGATTLPPSHHLEAVESTMTDEPENLFFKNNSMYIHKIMRINFTTYDVRRSQDVIHPGTHQCNIMTLLSQDSSFSDGDFLYGQVIGIFHVNVVYSGPSMPRRDYRPRRYDFLWVRWYEAVEPTPISWNRLQLDLLRFPPITSDGAFGFLNPSDVIRPCHIIPRLATGSVQQEPNATTSSIARSKMDYKMYYVNRCNIFHFLHYIYSIALVHGLVDSWIAT
jgi:hypothetical protein